MKTIYPIILLVLFLSACKQKTKEYLASENLDVSKIDTISIQKEIKEKQAQISYPTDFRKTQPDSIKTDFKIDSISVNQSLWYNNIQWITGTIDNNEKGIHLIVKNSKGKILYASKGQLDSWRYQPTLFKCEQTKKVVIINEIGAEESWGIDIQQYDNGAYKEIGALDIVALNEYEESLNVVPFIKIQELKDAVLQFSFDKNSKIFDSESGNTIQGDELLYQFQSNTLKRIN